MRLCFAIIAIFFVLPSAPAFAETSAAGDSFWEARENARAAADAVADERAEAEARAKARQKANDFQTYVKRQASLEVQIGLRLYEEYDDFRAITALQRYRILSGTESARFLTSLMIGQIYHRNEKATLAVMAFEDAVKHAPSEEARIWAYLIANQEMCLPLSLYYACRNRLQELGQQPLPDDVRDLVDYQVFYTEVVLRSPYVTEKRARLIGDQELQEKALGLVERNQAFEELDLQSPWAAGILSGVLPGAGQLYNGRWIDAAMAFSITGLFGAGTYYSIAELESVPLAIFSGLFTLGFYVGNIANAVTDAQRINAETYLEFFDQLKVDYWPRVTFDVQDNVVNFHYQFDWPGPTLESETEKFEEEMRRREEEEAKESEADAPEERVPAQPD